MQIESKEFNKDTRSSLSAKISISNARKNTKVLRFSYDKKTEDWGGNVLKRLYLAAI